jgi:hypothetical protein
MRENKLIFAFGIAVLLLSQACLAQGNASPSSCSTEYENHNQIDYGPLKVAIIEGSSVIQVGDQRQPGGVPGACLVLFTEKDHKLLMSVTADSEGRFSLKDIIPGHYRLVARAQGLCTANIPIEVVKSSHRRKLKIVFRPTGVDSCSYGEIAPKTE